MIYPTLQVSLLVIPLISILISPLLQLGDFKTNLINKILLFIFLLILN